MNIGEAPCGSPLGQIPRFANLGGSAKLEAARWLLGRTPIGPKVEPWPGTFAKMFDRVFGKIGSRRAFILHNTRILSTSRR